MTSILNKKNNFLVFLICTLFISCFTTQETTQKVIQETTQEITQEAAKHYTISGKVENPQENGKVILTNFNPITQVKTPVDTAAIAADGSYQLNFEFKEPDLFRVDFFKKQNVMLVVAEGQNNIQLDVEGVSKGHVSIAGSPDAQKLLAYDNFRQESYIKVVKPTYDTMRAAMDRADHEAEIEAVLNYTKASKVHRQELIDFTTKELGTSIALYGSMLRWTGDEEIDKLENLVQNFKKIHPSLKMTGIMEDKVQRFKKTAIGVIAPAIALVDTSGNPLSLADIKGKYTLIDFWASWCGPCLLQIPDLQKAYTTYHSKGFEILGVSIDAKGERWKSAIVKYDMAWPQVSDLKGWGAQPAADYNVTFIPFNLLIDSEGTIIAKNLHSKTLQNKLAELFESSTSSSK